VVRVAARVLLVDPAQRLLLFNGFDPHVPDRFFWFTAGGGLEPGEELHAGAQRELREETGLWVPPERLVGPVWLRRVQFTFEGVAYDSDEWWGTDDLRRTTETVYPLQLAELLPGLLADGWDGRLRLID
jgi:8-oxo-dGTP pyrophosphatase MutT (NUDIX family)